MESSDGVGSGRRWTRSILLVVLVGVALRSWSLVGQVDRPATMFDNRGHALREVQTSPSRFTCFRFDASVPVLLDGGSDGQPGVADHDDNADGIIDDARELGAVGSDDRCRTGVSLPGADRTPSFDSPISRVISNGAYVEDPTGKAGTRFYSDATGWLLKRPGD